MPDKIERRLTMPDKIELDAMTAMGHEGCPWWMDDDHFCASCDSLRPVIAFGRKCAEDARRESSGVISAAMRMDRTWNSAGECGNCDSWILRRALVDYLLSATNAPREGVGDENILQRV